LGPDAWLASQKEGWDRTSTAGTRKHIFHNVAGAIIRQRPRGPLYRRDRNVQGWRKLWGHYWQKADTKKFIEALGSPIIGIPMTEIMQAKQGGNDSGTCVHHQNAYHLAQWMDIAGLCGGRWCVAEVWDFLFFATTIP
jgi:hypothetical protein